MKRSRTVQVNVGDRTSQSGCELTLCVSLRAGTENGKVIIFQLKKAFTLRWTSFCVSLRNGKRSNVTIVWWKRKIYSENNIDSRRRPIKNNTDYQREPFWPTQIVVSLQSCNKYVMFCLVRWLLFHFLSPYKQCGVAWYTHIVGFAPLLQSGAIKTHLSPCVKAGNVPVFMGGGESAHFFCLDNSYGPCDYKSAIVVPWLP